MKKNVMMRLAAILLVCVLASTCGISGTYAKYVTDGTATDNARVAKFGVTVEGYTDMFHDSYKDTYTTYTALENTADITVQADSANTDLVAPGTQGTLSHFNIEGEPEVDVRVSYKADLELGTNWYVDRNNDSITEVYCPLVITVVYNGNTEVFVMTTDDVNDFEEDVEDYINSCAAIYHTNTDLSAVEDDLTVSWQWYFEAGTPGNPLSTYQDDIADTDLGDQAAKGNAATINITITCTITQVD